MANSTKVEVSKDYRKFKNLLGNRIVDAGHARQLENSILKENLLESMPILVNEKFEIIDGQHRFYLDVKNNWPVFYIMREGLTIKHARMLNATNRAWFLLDYLRSYVDAGIKTYERLQDFMEEYDLPPSLAAALMSGRTDSKKSIRRSFIDGTFEITNEEFARNVADALEELRPFYEVPAIRTRREFIKALVKALETVTVSDITAKLRSSGRTIAVRPTYRAWVRQLEDILSAGKPRVVRLSS